VPRQTTEARLNDLAAAFTELGPAWGRWVTACTPHESVSYIRLRMLRALEQEGDQTMTQLAYSLNVTQRRVTALVTALLGEELIDRAPNPSDGRSSIVSLTAVGRDHLDRRWPQFRNEVSQAFGDLPVEQQRQLLALTPALTEALRNRTARRLGGTRLDVRDH
jgi:DNA-binding MarR family transcriptional regulator